jgi:hypothetical protein
MIPPGAILLNVTRQIGAYDEDGQWQAGPAERFTVLGTAYQSEVLPAELRPEGARISQEWIICVAGGERVLLATDADGRIGDLVETGGRRLAITGAQDLADWGAVYRAAERGGDLAAE